MQVRSTENDTNSHSRTGRLKKTEKRQVGKYHILAELGRGGTASVYLAVSRSQAGVNKLVVLKALLPEYAEEEGAVSSFIDEARLATLLNHPNVVQTYDVGVEAERSVIVMEYLEGQALSRIFRVAQSVGKPFPLAMHLYVISQMLEGLHYVHELKGYDGAPLGLVHRDISPQNVFVTYDGQVKVLDFGIAKASASSGNTATGILKGKLAYMGPEQLTATNLDRRADIFSAGAMLWAAATGQRLWHGFSDLQIMKQVMGGNIPPPRALNLSCPPRLEEIVMKALSCDIEQRYQTASEFQSDLEQFAEGAGLVVRQRDIGKFLSELFHETRTELKTTIEQELTDLDTVYESLPPGGQRPPTVSEAARAAAELTENTLQAQVAERPKSRWIPVVLGVAIVALLGVVVGQRNGVREPDGLAAQAAGTPKVGVDLPTQARVEPPVDSPAQGSATVSPPQFSRVTFRIDPPNASVVVDGTLLPIGTESTSLPTNSKEHRVVVEAQDYIPQNLVFVADTDQTITVTLQRQAAAPKSDTVRRSYKAPVTPGPAPAAAKPCDNPFFLDAQGIKKVKPGCF